MKSVGVILEISEVPRLSARPEKTANGDRALKIQVWRVLLALKYYAG